MLCLRAIFIFSIIYIEINAIPPEACFANFRSEDCGGPPVRVIYYWKPGSRCEVGVWRGCRPNMNMFKDEYECVATCIFVARASPEDYHILDALDKNDTLVDDSTPMTMTDQNTTEPIELETNTGTDENRTDTGAGTTAAADDGSKSDNNTNAAGDNSTPGPESDNTAKS